MTEKPLVALLLTKTLSGKEISCKSVLKKKKWTLGLSLSPFLSIVKLSTVDQKDVDSIWRFERRLKHFVESTTRVNQTESQIGDLGTRDSKVDIPLKKNFLSFNLFLNKVKCVWCKLHFKLHPWLKPFIAFQPVYENKRLSAENTPHFCLYKSKKTSISLSCITCLFHEVKSFVNRPII